MRGRPQRQGLFHGYWTDLDGKRLRRIWRSEYGEQYRLNRLCREQEPLPDHKWLVVSDGYIKIQFPGVPVFVERWQQGQTKMPDIALTAIPETVPAASAMELA